MKAHPAAELFPMLTDTELKELADSIKFHGQHVPIVTYQGQILDGRNRFAACQLIGSVPRTVEWNPKDGESPWDYVWSLNADRRHLDCGQKAAIKLKVMRASEAWLNELAVKQAEAKASKSKGRPRNTEEITAPQARGSFSERQKKGVEARALAKAAGVSPVTAERAIRLHRKAPEMFEKVAAGEKSLCSALDEIGRVKPEPAPTEPPCAAASNEEQIDPIVQQVLGPFRARVDSFYKLLRQCEKEARDLRRNVPIANQATAFAKMPELVAAIAQALRYAEAMVPHGPCPVCGGIKPFCSGRVRCGGWVSIVKEAAE